MKKYITALVLFTAAIAMLVFVTATPSAQDPRLPPTYGSANLKVGFKPDPHTKEVVAGGKILTTLGGVRAYVAKAPDYRIHYTPGKVPLTFYVTSSADTTLLINLPNGAWIANDDSAGTLNPSIHFANPPAGQYDIWVGTVNPNNARAVLHVTERRSPF